jgi:membrane associated rhomboid family serine protease
MQGSQGPLPLTQTVKWLIGINLAIWLFGVLIFQRLVLHSDILFQYFGMVPAQVLHHFWIWQPFTYMFLHSTSPMHVLLNMMILWWFGSELEAQWGRAFFLLYYLVCGVGAAFIYVAGVSLYGLMANDYLPLAEPVVGASGAVYGLLVAYGIIFSERVIYFMMLFPMKAKHFVWIMGLIEFATLLDSGMSSGVANLAHLGGILSGYLFLVFWTKWRPRFQRSTTTSRRGRKLKLVVNNEKSTFGGKNGPKYWN